MSTRQLITVAELLAMALAAAPMSALHSQTPANQDSASRRTWKVNPGRPASPQAGLDIKADTGSVRQAVTGNVLEIRLGTIAERKATNPAVKQFAQQMVKDHTAMEKQWTALGAKNGVPVPTLDPAGQQAVSRMERLSGADFDRTYMTSMVQDHQQTVTLLQRLAQQAVSADVRQVASNGLPTVQQHLTMAEQVEGQLGRMAGVAGNVPSSGQPGQVTTNAQAARQNANVDRDLEKDREFIRQLTEDHVLEVRLGEMAQRKATDSDVKHLAENILSDFTKWQSRWEDIEVRSGTTSRPVVGSIREPKVDRLQSASGKKFDRLYVATVFEHLQSLVPSLDQKRRSLHSSEAQRMIDDELPRLRQHLADVKSFREHHPEFWAKKEKK
jgi:putative membrane protein